MLKIRPIERADEPEWRRLWTGYLEFYEAAASETVYATTFERLFADGLYEPNGFLAFSEERAVGLVHYFQHRHCWHVENVIYLQDLFAAPEARGLGVGRALIEAVYAEADRLRLAGVYWTTAEDNAAARRLYDRIAKKTPFIKYQR
ncbi:MAG: GNAT family N-acetyltransferase [Pseudomonadota bacterium]